MRAPQQELTRLNPGECGRAEKERMDYAKKLIRICWINKKNNIPCERLGQMCTHRINPCECRGPSSRNSHRIISRWVSKVRDVIRLLIWVGLFSKSKTNKPNQHLLSTTRNRKSFFFGFAAHPLMHLFSGLLSYHRNLLVFIQGPLYWYTDPFCCGSHPSFISQLASDLVLQHTNAFVCRSFISLVLIQGPLYWPLLLIHGPFCCWLSSFTTVSDFINLVPYIIWIL